MPCFPLDMPSTRHQVSGRPRLFPDPVGCASQLTRRAVTALLVTQLSQHNRSGHPADRRASADSGLPPSRISPYILSETALRHTPKISNPATPLVKDERHVTITTSLLHTSLRQEEPPCLILGPYSATVGNFQRTTCSRENYQ